MKTLLINPPQLFSKTQVAAGVIPPLGLLYLSSYLKKEGYRVEILDALVEGAGTINELLVANCRLTYRGLSFNEIIKRIDSAYKIVGISSLFSFAFPIVLKLTEAIKAAFPEIIIVVGGAHVSALPSEVIMNKSIDFVVIGEGEETFKKLLAEIEFGNNNFKEIDGLAYKFAGKTFTNPKKQYIENLDSLPFPDRAAVPLEKYYEINEAHGPTGLKWTPLLSSRGCPYGCTFCTSALWSRKFRARSAENVVAEIEECIRKYDIKEFHFEDENLTLDHARINRICDIIIEKKLNIKWQTPNGIRASVTDENTLLKMKQSGCNHVTFAPESGSERVLKDIINKSQDLNKVTRLIKYCHKIKLKCCAYFVLGLPGETSADVGLSIRYAMKLARLGLNEVTFSLFIPLPGSYLYDELKKQGKLVDDWQAMISIGDLARARSWSENISDRELNRLRQKAYLSFYLVRLIFHPLKIMEMIINIFRGRKTLKTERVAETFLKRLKS